MILKEDNHKVDKFNEIYEQDRLMARIYAFVNNPHIDYINLNETAIDKFQIFNTKLKYGVSKTLKRYVSKKTDKKIFVNKSKFYIKNTKFLRPLTLLDISYPEIIYELFLQRFPWIKYLNETGFQHISFNTVIKYKLYKSEKLLRHFYKCSPDKALLVKNQFTLKEWEIVLKSAYNSEKTNPEILCDKNLLFDTCLIGYKINKKVNLAWSIKRLKEEHDQCARIYTVYLSRIENKILYIKEIYKDFNDFIGGGLITESSDLVYEGLRQGHCVASYSGNINRGNCAIFRISGYTAEINCDSSKNSLRLGQFKGFRNCDPPKELIDEVELKILKFNEKIKIKQYSPSLHYESDEAQLDWY